MSGQAINPTGTRTTATTIVSSSRPGLMIYLRCGRGYGAAEMLAHEMEDKMLDA